jgi:hypothetical protein
MGDMDSDVMSSTLLASVLSAAVILISALSVYWRRPKAFNVPTIGLEDADSNTLKLRYIQEADVLLREGYRKVYRTLAQYVAHIRPGC